MTLFKSVDGGDSWTTHIVSGEGGYGYAVAIDHGNDNLVYIGGSLASKPALFKSVDGGANWTSVTGSISGIITALAVDPDVPTRVYAGAMTGIFRSEDGGSSWEKRAPHDAVCLKVNPLKPSEVYAGGTAGLFMSRDHGDTWTSLNEGMTVSQVSCFDLNPQGKILYAGTSGGGILKKNKDDRYMLVIKAEAGGTTTPPPGTYFYSQGQAVDLEALPDEDCTFEGWTGSLASADRRLRIVMNSDLALRANFLRRILAPLQLSGQKKVDRSLLLARYINVLTWQANPDNAEIGGYRIYLMNGQAMSLLAEVGADTYEWSHMEVNKDEAYRYAVCAFDAQGRQGEFSYVEIR